MAKYIDAEKLKSEIERHRQAIRVLNEHTAPEQKSKTCAIFQYPDTILSELLSFIDSLQQEQPEVQDLAEMVQSKSPLSVAYANRCFENGKQAMKEQMLKEAVEADVNTYKNLEEGTSWAEFVVEMPTNKLGDKVRIIIVREDEK